MEDEARCTTSLVPLQTISKSNSRQMLLLTADPAITIAHPFPISRLPQSLSRSKLALLDQRWIDQPSRASNLLPFIHTTSLYKQPSSVVVEVLSSDDEADNTSQTNCDRIDPAAMIDE